MCTAITYNAENFYFGRTLDYEFSYGEEVTITPKNFPFEFGLAGKLQSHYAIIGMAHILNNYPLYYDAANEKGLCMAALNFVGNAKYNGEIEGKQNIAQFEFIPYILANCASVQEAKEKLKNVNITNTPFCDGLPAASLHWLISDKRESITVEFTGEMNVYKNPVGVLTNNPPFPMQLFSLNNYMNLSNSSPKNLFSDKIDLQHYSRGMGALGLPGDLSSQSRFIRVAFTKLNSVCESGEQISVGQFFHILGSVLQVKGCCDVGNGEYEISIYSSCVNADKGIYYYKTYQNHQITAVDMNKEDLLGSELIHYPLITENKINFQN